jgi:hypothetical protein
MSRLEQIEQRHGRDRWKDAVFIAGAVLLTALSIGSVTSKAQGKAPQHTWSLTVLESTPEVDRTSQLITGTTPAP